jgi:hypothetical protein
MAAKRPALCGEERAAAASGRSETVRDCSVASPGCIDGCIIVLRSFRKSRSMQLRRFILVPIAVVLPITQPVVIRVAARSQPQAQVSAPAGSGLRAKQTVPQSAPAGIKLDQNGIGGRLSGRVLKNATPKEPALRPARPESADSNLAEKRRTAKSRDNHFWADRIEKVGVASVSSCLGTGSGDIQEIEPNDTNAQEVCMPVNVIGAINPFGDVDFFAFQAFANEQINVEAFASRIPGSNLIADTALFDTSGNMLVESAGDGFSDPLIQFSVTQDQVLIAGITDIEGFGGSSFVYLLNIEGGMDVQEAEPNDRSPQPLPALPVTIFGNVSSTTDVDLYSFSATAGTTLIADVDAQIMGSTLDSELSLTDPSTGIQYFYNDDFDAGDPRFNIVLPFTGAYVIAIDAFNQDSSGAYRLNLSLVPGSGAPVLTGFSILGPKQIQITGTGLQSGATVAVNGFDKKTSQVDSGTFVARAKAKRGQTVTIANPDGRRSNPFLIQ